MKEIPIDGFCYGEQHRKCYFMREMPNKSKFCGLWMRNITGVMNNKKRAFKCFFCNASSVVIKSNAGPAFIENPPDVDIGGRMVSN